jgi:hypothetical protein
MAPAILSENERCAPSGAFLGSAQPCHAKSALFLTLPYLPFGDAARPQVKAVLDGMQFRMQ